MDTILPVVSMIVIAASFVAILLGLRLTRESKFSTKITTIFIICFISSVGLSVLRKATADKFYKEVHEKAASYSVYMNGSLVGSDKVVFEDYDAEKIHIDDEEQEIYISATQ